MSRMKSVFGFALLAGALSGCTNVSSAMPGMSPATGEAWYSKDTTFFGLPLGSEIYYCSKETPTRCTKAVWYNLGEARPSSAPPAAATPGAPAASATSATPATPAAAGPAAPGDPAACQKAQEYKKRAAAMDEGPARTQIQRLAERKAAECAAQQSPAPAP